MNPHICPPLFGVFFTYDSVNLLSPCLLTTTTSQIPNNNPFNSHHSINNSSHPIPLPTPVKVNQPLKSSYISMNGYLCAFTANCLFSWMCYLECLQKSCNMIWLSCLILACWNMLSGIGGLQVSEWYKAGNEENHKCIWPRRDGGVVDEEGVETKRDHLCCMDSSKSKFMEIEWCAI